MPLLDIFLLIFDGGIRPKESLSLEWSDLLWDKNLIHVRGTKSEGSYRHVPMSEGVKQALRVRAQGAKSRFVFPAKLKKDAPLSYVAIAKRFTRLREAAGIPDDLVLYSGRHTFATDLLDRTGNIKLVSEVLGHASVLTTERYLHPSKRGLAEHINARNATRSRRGEIAACHILRHSAAMVQ
jgi:integrase